MYATELARKSEFFRPVTKLRITFWALAVILGLAQTWYIRHRIFSDGISYLDIATYYSQGNWSAALNDYWSPLYSWLLAVAMLVIHPTPYWQVATLHFINFGGYLASLLGFEMLMSKLIIFQRSRSGSAGLSEPTMRIVGYTNFLVGTLVLIGLGYCSPDMICTAIIFSLASVLLDIHLGEAGIGSYVILGALLALGYLTRAAFLPITAVYVVTVAILLFKARKRVLAPVALICATAILVGAPFVIALSISKGRFTFGEAGKLNYGWEVLGAARSTNWQGEPGNIGRPKHPSKKLLSDPAVYTFASPVPGSYPLWYEPSYWYEGISTHLALGPQIKVLARTSRYVLLRFLLSPVPIVCAALTLLTGWRRWLSPNGIAAYWFLLAPSLFYIGLYMLVFIDKRYIAGSLVVIWMCLLASIGIPGQQTRKRANLGVQSFSTLILLIVIVGRLLKPTMLAARDLVQGRENELNEQGVIADRFLAIGLTPGDRIAYVGTAIDADWVRLDHLRIVAEVPVIWDRSSGLFSTVIANTSEISKFWRASAQQKDRIYDAFRDAGAVIAIADELPRGVATEGWNELLRKDMSGLPQTDAQIPRTPGIAYRWLSPDQAQSTSTER